MTKQELDANMARLEKVTRERMNAPWTQTQAPFKVIENVYCVGTNWVSAYLIDTPQGLILIDCMYREVLYQLIDNIRALGFDPHDIKHLLLTHGHFDHCGAVREIVEMSGCEVWIGQGRHFHVPLHRPALLVLFLPERCRMRPGRSMYGLFHGQQAGCPAKRPDTTGVDR